MAARRPEGAVAIRLSEQSDVLSHGAPLVTLANRTGSTVRNRDISRCVAADDGGRWSCAMTGKVGPVLIRRRMAM